MNSVLKWAVAVVGWAAVLIVFAVWKDADAHMANGPLSGFFRGVFVFGGMYLIYRWAKGGKPKE